MAHRFDDTDSLPLPPTLDTGRWHNDKAGSEADDMQRDRFRLGRELARDFEDMATSTGPLPQDNGDYTNTLGSLDIGGNANQPSTRAVPLAVPKKYRDNYSPSDSMLHHSPSTLDVEGMQAQFADFSMAADHRAYESDSYEVGRGHRDPRIDSLLNSTTDFFSMNPVVRPDRGRQNASPDQNTVGRMAKSHIRSRKQTAPAQGSPLQKSKVPSLEFSTSTTRKRPGTHTVSPSHRRAEQPSKIMDVVSSADSAGSSSKARDSLRDRDSEEEALSEINEQQKRSRIPTSKNARKSSVPAAKNRPMDDEKLSGATRVRKGKAVAPIPKAFKSTSDFLKELGIDNHTHTLQLQNKLEELKSTASHGHQGGGSARSRPLETSSFEIPKLPDMTDLFSANDVTRFSIKKGAAITSHVPIESIPVPHDSRALLAALKLLEQKVDRLENARASNQQTCKRLEDELRRAENRHQVKQRNYRRQVADTTFNLSENDDALERAHEKANIEWKMEKLKMETHIETLRHNIDQVSEQLDEARHFLREFQEDHEAAISSVATAIAAQEDLKVANQKLERQLAQSELDRQQAEHAASKQRQEYEAMELKLRKRARDAREAAAAAEEAMLNAARRELEAKQVVSKLRSVSLQDIPASQEQNTAREEAEQPVRQRQSRADFDERVRDELLRVRPDLFRHRTSAIKVSHGTPKQTIDAEECKRNVGIPPKGRRAYRTRAQSTTPEEPCQTPVQEREGTNPIRAPILDDAIKLTLLPDEVHKLRRDIHAERHGRKATEHPSTTPEQPVISRSLSHFPLRDGRRIVKVVYLLDDNTEVVRLTNEVDDARKPDGQGNAVHEPVAPPETLRQKERPRTPQKDGPQSSAPSVRFAEPTNVSERSNNAADLNAQPKYVSHDDHDPEQCTVCLRYNRLRRQQQSQDEDNPIADIDASVIMPAPELDPGARRTAGSDSAINGDCTARPSADPKLQLERVVKQLQDEFFHLKLIYQTKSNAFAQLDPSVGWHRRKALTTELNDLVAEMGAKADQIYALYDVKEEIVGCQARGPIGTESEGTEDLLHILGNRC